MAKDIMAAVILAGLAALMVWRTMVLVTAIIRAVREDRDE